MRHTGGRAQQWRILALAREMRKAVAWAIDDTIRYAAETTSEFLGAVVATSVQEGWIQAGVRARKSQALIRGQDSLVFFFLFSCGLFSLAKWDWRGNMFSAYKYIPESKCEWRERRRDTEGQQQKSKRVGTGHKYI